MDYTSQYISKELARVMSDDMNIDPSKASDEQLYKALAIVIRNIAEHKRKAFMAKCNAAGKKQVYYLCMEFLMGKSLRNSLSNLGLTEAAAQALTGYGVSLPALYKYEPDPGLGNGGLGRLAACYLDGLATCGYPAMGHSILYEYGLFKQKIEDGWQKELPDYWLPGGEVWLEPVPEHTVEVRFGGQLSEKWDCGHLMTANTGYTTVLAVPYNMYVTGYDTEAISVLRLWQAKAPGLDMELFNQGDYIGAVGKNSYAETISKVLYPNDNHAEGKQLRLRQQYFLSAAAVSDMFRRHMSAYGTVDNFAEKNAVQLNDTHPALAIPELMRILLDECGYSWEKSWGILSRTFSYTNHTVMSEALEKWSLHTIQTLLPRIYQIICEIDRRLIENLRARGTSESDINSMRIISDGQVRMANLCVACCHHVNGVSRLHSQIIKDDVFHSFYKLTPAKFTNVTNGIASRRWLLQANPRLTGFISDRIGSDFLKDMGRLTDLKGFLDDSGSLAELAGIKRENKLAFADYMNRERGEHMNPDSIYYVQVKRLHEYKRQQLNALRILEHYMDIKDDPSKPFIPRTYIFGAKAAPGYFLAKQIIKFICDLNNMIDADGDARGKLDIVFIEEYNVSVSELLMPASEVSQQISLAGTEASGTGNMKLMLNGAVTLGTMDGANVEIAEAVGEDNIVIFGMRSDEAERMAGNGYTPRTVLENDAGLRRIIDFMKRRSDTPSFTALADYLENNDQYMALADYRSYAEAEEKTARIYADDNSRWQSMSLRNIAESGRFCADRAIREYARNIWGL